MDEQYRMDRFFYQLSNSNNPLIWISHLIFLGSCDSVPNLSSQTPTKARLQLRRASVSLDEGQFPQNNVQTLLSRHRSLQVKYFSLFLDRVKHYGCTCKYYQHFITCCLVGFSRIGNS